MGYGMNVQHKCLYHCFIGILFVEKYTYERNILNLAHYIYIIL